MPKKIVFNNPPLTKKRFLGLLKKAAQPVSEWNKPDSEVKGTSDSHHADGCIGKRKSQGKIEGKEG